MIPPRKGSARIIMSVVLASLPIVGGCRDDKNVVAPVVDLRASQNRQSVRGDSPWADTLAKGVALALGNATVRSHLRDDLRDAPFRKHGIHLTSYLSSQQGAYLRDAAAAPLGLSTDSLLRIIRGLPQLEIVMPRSMDRWSWSGTSDVAVFGTSATLSDRAQVEQSEIGFTTDGQSIDIDVWGYARFPYVAIRAAQTDFGTDPEGARARAPKHTERNTVSTRKEELFAITKGIIDSSTPPGLQPAALARPSSPPSAPSGTSLRTPGAARTTMVSSTYGGMTLPAYMSWNYCAGGGWTLQNDRDQDAIIDECESYLWAAFYPWYLMSAYDRAPGGEDYFAVGRYPYASGRLQIIYAPAYYYDPGDPVFNYDAHDGDSEWVIVEIVPLGATSAGYEWGTEYVTYSAHYGSEVDGTERLHWDFGVETGASSPHIPYSAIRGYPNVYVAQDKHANYATKSKCQNGGFSIPGFSGWDRCDDYGYDWPFYIDESSQFNIVSLAPSRNLGNYYQFANPVASARLIDCTNSRNDPGRQGVECFWTNDEYFAGWISNPGTAGNKATPYRRILAEKLF